MNSTLFDHLDFSNESSQKDAIEILVKSFQDSTSIPRKQIALEMLNQMFSRFSFDLKAFIKTYRLSSDQITKFLSYLLYGVYYKQILLALLSKFQSGNYFEHYFFVLLAESVGKRKIYNILTSLTLREQLELIVYCCWHIREGSWLILDLFEQMYQKDVEKTIFIQRIRRRYYEVHVLDTILKDTDPHNEIVFKSIIDQLEEYAENQVLKIMQILPELIELAITLPVRTLEALSRRDVDDRSLPISEQEEKGNAMKFAKESQAKITELFSKYRNHEYSYEDYRSLFQMFGLRGQYVYYPIIQDPFPLISEILAKLLELFQDPVRMSNDYIYSFTHFLLSICRELYAFSVGTEEYASGLNRLVYALITRGTNFSNLAWLPSVLKGFDEICKHLKEKGKSSFSLKKHPIIIFDQSDARQFAKNKRYIRQMEKTYLVPIVHFSLKQTVDFAKKLGVAHWIQTTPEGTFGFGGARNCVFYLAPVIHKAYKTGRCTFSSLMKIKEDELRSIFDETVLGKEGKDVIIHLGEDDVGILPCNFFADALFAEHSWNLYFFRFSFGTGRATQKIDTNLDLTSIFNNPSIAFSSTIWVDYPDLSGMKGMLSKPRFCVPLPFGCEECHVITPITAIDFFQQPIAHLAGSRFPDNTIPVSPLDGIEVFFNQFLPYSLLLFLSYTIFDSKNDSNRCVFPWNDETVLKSSIIQCMGNLWWYLSLPATQIDLKNRFWRNMRTIFKENASKEVPFIQRIENLTKVDLTLPIPEPLKEYYLNIQKDARLFLIFGKLIVSLQKKGEVDYLEKAQKIVEKEFKIKILDTQLTKGLYILVNCMESFGEKLIQLPFVKSARDFSSD